MMRSPRRTLATVASALVLGAAMAPLLVRAYSAAQAPQAARASAGMTAISLPQSFAIFTVRKLEGDVTGDCAVRIDDDQSEATRYLAARGNLRYSPAYDVNLPSPDFIIDAHDIQFVVGRNGSTCAAPIPPQPPIQPNMPPVTAPVTLTKEPAYANIWFCQPGVGSCGATPPTRLDAHNWQNGVIIDEVLTINDGTQVSAFQFDLRFDPAIFQPPTIADLGVLGGGSSCTTNAPAYGVVTFRCVSAGVTVNWSGPRTVARVTLLVNRSLDSMLRPAKENGLVSSVFDIGAITSPGPTPTATTTPPATTTALATGTAAATTTAERTQTAAATGTPPVGTRTAAATTTAERTRTPAATGTPPVGTRTAAATATGSASATPPGTGTPPVETGTSVPTATNTPSSGTAIPGVTNTAVLTLTNTPPAGTSTAPPGSRTPAAPASATAGVAGAGTPSRTATATPTEVSSVLGSQPRSPISALPGTGAPARYRWWNAVVAALLLTFGGWAVLRVGWDLWRGRTGRR